MRAQPLAANQEPQQAPTPAMSRSSGDSQAMLAHVNGDAADSPAAAEPASEDQGLQVAAPVMSEPRTSAAGPCGAMHTPAMAALLCGQPAKGVPDAIDVMGIGQHKPGGEPGQWRGVQLAGGPVEAQVGLPTSVILQSACSGARPSRQQSIHLQQEPDRLSRVNVDEALATCIAAQRYVCFLVTDRNRNQ